MTGTLNFYGSTREMIDAATRIVKALGLSGMIGFDFMIEAATGAALLIEMNPRNTPICAVRLGPGRDLAEALVARISGRPARDRPPRTERDIVVFFPDTWSEDPASQFLNSGYHDVPWEQPDLVRALMLPPDATATDLAGAPPGVARHEHQSVTATPDRYDARQTHACSRHGEPASVSAGVRTPPRMICSSLSLADSVMRRPSNLMKTTDGGTAHAVHPADPGPPSNYLDLYGLSKSPFGARDGCRWLYSFRVPPARV